MNVKSPMLFLVQVAKLNRELFGVTYTQTHTPEEQTTSAIELVNLAGFQQQYLDATKSERFFKVPASEPHPRPRPEARIPEDGTFASVSPPVAD